jgi:hypothetical protein
MSSTERSRRFLNRIRGTGTAAQASPLEAECAKPKSENDTLKRLLDEHRRGSQAQLKARPHQQFGERDEIGKLKSEILKLKAMLKEEPDVAKLRKKVVDQQVEMAAMRREMKAITKERDRDRTWHTPEGEKARRLLTGPNYHVLVKALHSDRRQQVSSAELAEAERVAVALRPLFIETD